MAHRVTRRQFISSSAAALALGVGVAPRASAAVDPVDLGVLRAGSGGAAGGRIIGLVDAHAHLAASKAFGGTMRCGSPIGPIQEALAGCEAHAGLGTGALLEAIVGGGDLAAGRDGWPTFRTWPTYNSELHEQAYYRFVERAWRGGLRVINALLVSNRVIAELYSGMSKRIDEMDEVRVQHRFVHRMQDYIDRECGGPGKGWFRIARTPADVRTVAADGKLAVVLGVENSELFGGRIVDGRPQCTADDVDRGLDEMVSLGINNLFPVHKFDNAFGGTRFDPGVTGIAINIGSRLSTGRFWRAEPAGDGPADHSVEFAADDFARLLRSVPALRGVGVPVYPSGPVRNIRGLTDLGRRVVAGMMDRGMIVNIDHMGVTTATSVLEMLETRSYSGVMSAHSWADRTILHRTVALSGFAAGYSHPAHHSDDGGIGFLDEWKANRSGPRVGGYGYGSDVNGLAPLPEPTAETTLRYPFTAINGARMTRMRAGTRVYDLNDDGVPHYGLYPDWCADLLDQAGAEGPALRGDLLSGAEAFTAMWERARAGSGL